MPDVTPMSLSDRMKMYENKNKPFLEKKQPVIIRIDGKAFHTFTKHLDKPFDEWLTRCMQNTMVELCQGIQNCVFGYTQSDEISLLLVDYETPETDSWFGNNLQKIVSVSASMATAAFNTSYFSVPREFTDYNDPSFRSDFADWSKKHYRHGEDFKVLKAMFDSRAFVLPKDEVVNYFIYRQQDAIRNSVQSVGQSYFSHKELHKKTVIDIKQMLWEIYDYDWESLDSHLKRGSCCYKGIEIIDNMAVRYPFVLDCDIPLFTENREFVEGWVKSW